MSVKDPSIRRWLSKNCSSNNSSCNEVKLHQPLDKHQKKPPTPVRKRSSLARPVRVHDSFPHEIRPVIIDWDEYHNSQYEQSLQQWQSHLEHKASKSLKSKCDERRKEEQLDQAIDDLVEVRIDEEVTTWPIRFRLSEFFELSLSKCRSHKRRRRHRMMIATMREGTMKSMMEAGGMRPGRGLQQSAFKDTERLLRVLSINNVDQESRYNVARCSVM